MFGHCGIFLKKGGEEISLQSTKQIQGTNKGDTLLQSTTTTSKADLSEIRQRRKWMMPVGMHRKEGDRTPISVSREWRTNDCRHVYYY